MSVLDEQLLPAGRRIKIIRVARGLTLKQASEMSGIPISTLSAMERGMRRPIDNETNRRLLECYRAANLADEILAKSLTPIELEHVIEWLRSERRLPVQLAFAEGPERDLAIEIEAAIQREKVEEEAGR